MMVKQSRPKEEMSIFDFHEICAWERNRLIFFNGIREIYSEGSHPRRAEYGEKCCRKLAAFKSNFMWSILVLIHDPEEFP